MRPFVLVPGYVYVFSSSLVSQALCPAACSGRGSCVNGTCACLPGWSAADCSVPSCDTCPLRSTCDAQVVFNGLHAHSSHWFLRKCNAHSVSKHTTCPSLALAKQAVPPTCIHPHPPTSSAVCCLCFGRRSVTVTWVGWVLRATHPPHATASVTAPRQQTACVWTWTCAAVCMATSAATARRLQTAPASVAVATRVCVCATACVSVRRGSVVWAVRTLSAREAALTTASVWCPMCVSATMDGAGRAAGDVQRSPSHAVHVDFMLTLSVTLQLRGHQDPLPLFSFRKPLQLGVLLAAAMHITIAAADFACVCVSVCSFVVTACLCVTP